MALASARVREARDGEEGEVVQPRPEQAQQRHQLRVHVQARRRVEQAERAHGGGGVLEEAPTGHRPEGAYGRVAGSVVDMSWTRQPPPAPPRLGDVAFTAHFIAHAKPVRLPRSRSKSKIDELNN